jgi:hypothetical protein
MPRGNNGIGMAALAVAVGVAAFAVILGSQRGSRSPPPTTTAAETAETAVAHVPQRTTAGLAARGFIAAYNDLDAGRALHYLADDADISGLVTSVGDHSLAGTRGDFRLLLSLLEAQGYEQLPGVSCKELSSSLDATTLRCFYAFHDLRSDELGLGPFRGSSFLFTVRDGKIVQASQAWATDEFSPQVWEPFAAWVTSRYPEDAAVMYSGSGARVSAESARLWEKRSREYVQVETANGADVRIAERFMEARDAHDSARAMSLVADDGISARLLWDNAPYPNMPAVRMTRRRAALALEAERIYGVRYRSVRCRLHPVRGFQGRARIICSYRMNSRLRRISGLPPDRGSFGIGVRNGKVTYTSFPWLNVSFPSWVPVEGAAFTQWLEERHPEAGEPLYRGSLFRTIGQELVLILRPRPLDLLARYLDEYEHAAEG